MKISVCMATYNGARHLHAQIASIIKQLNDLDQLIIVDDHSKDNTVEIIRDFNDPRIQLIINPFNIGVALTFDRALHQAEGDLVFLSDQDDFWYDDKVSTIKDMFMAQKLDLIVHDAAVMGNGTVIHTSLFEMVDSAPGVIKNIISNTFTGCCMAFRREILREILPISPHIGIFHDAWIGVLAEYFGYKITFLHKPLMDFNRHGQNTSTMKRRKIIPIMRDRVAFIFALVIQIFKMHIKRITG